MATLKDLLNSYAQSIASTTTVIYGTALADSSNGEVLVKLDDPVDDTYDSLDGVDEIILSDEDDIESAIDDDSDADILLPSDDEDDIDADETEYYVPDGDMGAV